LTFRLSLGFLRVGFGEAGAGIISANLSTTSRSLAIDPLIPGIRVYAIFGFCDIHHFEESKNCAFIVVLLPSEFLPYLIVCVFFFPVYLVVNRKLGADVLTFINNIAEIVHSNVHAWGGQCNKNLGNAFVIVWRIGDEKTLIESNQHSILTRKRIGTGTPKPDGSPHQSGKRWKDTFSEHSHSNVSSPKTPFSTSKRFGYNSERLSERDRFRDDASSNYDSDDNVSVYSSGMNGDSEKQKKKPAYRVDLRRVPGVDQLADAALVGYLKVIVDINRSSTILNYRKDERLAPSSNYHPRRTPIPSGMPSEANDSSLSGLKQSNHDSLSSSANMEEKGGSFKGGSLRDKINEMKKQQSQEQEFKVRMGFGLHAGWAIEGAVGSIHKVDATYLSPHVNMAARLETSSRQYKVPLLMSHFFYELLSEIPQKKCRKLDVITVKGSEIPTAVYTYDCFQDQIFTDLSGTSSNAPLTARTLHKFMSLARLGMNHSSSGRKLSGLSGHSAHQRRGSRISSGSVASGPSSPFQPSAFSPLKRIRGSIEAITRSRSPSFSDVNPSAVVEGETKESNLESNVIHNVELIARPPSIIAPAALLTTSHPANASSVPFEANSLEDVPEMPGVTPLSGRSDDSDSPSPGPTQEPDASPVDGEAKEVEVKPLNVSAKRKRRKRSIPVIVLSLPSPTDERHEGSTPGGGNTIPISPPRSTAMEPSGSPAHVPNQTGYLPLKINDSPPPSQQLSQLHQQLMKQKEVDEERNHITSSSHRRSEVSHHFHSSHHGSSEARKLPLPPLSIHHSPKARLLLGQVHRELRQVQREIDRKTDNTSSSSLTEEIKMRRSNLHATKEVDQEDVITPMEEEIDFNAIEEYLKLLFPESEILIPPVLNDDYPEIFLKDTDLLQLKCHITEHFYDVFTKGVNEYIKGNWLKAKNYLEDSNRLMEDCIVHFMKTPLYRQNERNEKENNPETVVPMVHDRRDRSSLRRMSLLSTTTSPPTNELTSPAVPVGQNRLSLSLINPIRRLSYSPVDNSDLLLYGDGPSQTLLDYMKQTNYIAPADWKGYRPLTSK
jgi:hypothetical protein